jgi:hypothetical protein
MSFAVTVLPAVAGHRWVCVEGPVDASSAADVRAVVATALAMPTRRLTIDLRRARADDVGECVIAELVSTAARLGVEVRALQLGLADHGGSQASDVTAQPRQRPVPAMVAG